jgi:hypothetical protein
MQAVDEIEAHAQGTLADFQSDMLGSRKTVSAIVPVFDEETTVKIVVEVSSSVSFPDSSRPKLQNDTFIQLSIHDGVPLCS